KINIGRLFSIILSVGIVMAIAISAWGFSYIAVQIKAAPILDVSDFNSTDSSKIYASDGTLISDVGYQLRENVSYSDFPQTLVDAFVSIEDSRFFDHNGFDIPRFTKAVFENIMTSIKDRKLVFAQGGSTFTMQLVKNTYFVTEDSNAADSGWAGINRKIQEIYLALELENVVGKERILELYLNMINFGVPGNKRGIQTAAQYYFGKEVNQLSLIESAMLAGIINAPTTFSPINDLQASIDRTHTVLNLMVTHGYISSDEASIAKKIDIENLIVGNLNNSDELPYQAYVDAVIDEVISLTGLNPIDVPMKIYTSMNVSLQNAIETIQNNKYRVKWPDDLMQTAIVTLNNKTGEIVGLGGGRYYNGQRLFNRATSMYRQPGSAVKPVLPYVLAFEYLGWATDHVIEDHPYSFSEINDKMIVSNVDNRYHGDIFIGNAIGNSWNVPAILTMKDVVNTMGYKAVTDYLNSIGFTDIHLTGDKVFDLGYAIGGSTFNVTPVSLAGAHAAIVNAGNYIVPHTVTRIEFLDGNAPLEPTYSSTKVVSSEAAYLSTMMMEQNVSVNWSNGLQMLKRDYQVYAKTGTSDWGDEGLKYGIPNNAAKDKWVVGSTSEYSIAVWTGY
ncbi:MAG: transglycosylase domain-containing protein, partial [Erysipelotrichaceae bacterium]